MKTYSLILLFFCFGVCKGQSHGRQIGGNRIADSYGFSKYPKPDSLRYEVRNCDSGWKFMPTIGTTSLLIVADTCVPDSTYKRLLDEFDKNMEGEVGGFSNGGHNIAIGKFDLWGLSTVDSIMPNGEIYDPLKYDTVKVLCQVSDTAAVEIKPGLILFHTTGTNDTISPKSYYKREVEWWYLYSVREKIQGSTGTAMNGSMYCDNCGRKHLYYLDEKLNPLPKNIVVWQSIELSK